MENSLPQVSISDQEQAIKPCEGQYDTKEILLGKLRIIQTLIDNKGHKYE